MKERKLQKEEEEANIKPSLTWRLSTKTEGLSVSMDKSPISMVLYSRKSRYMKRELWMLFTAKTSKNWSRTKDIIQFTVGETRNNLNKKIIRTWHQLMKMMMTINLFLSIVKESNIGIISFREDRKSLRKYSGKFLCRKLSSL